MLILILIDVQYLQNVVFGFEKGSNGQNHHSIKNFFPAKFPILATDGGNSPYPLTLFGKPCTNVQSSKKMTFLLFSYEKVTPYFKQHMETSS